MMTNKTQDFIPAHLLADKPPEPDFFDRKDTEKERPPLVFSKTLMQRIGVNPQHCFLVCLHGEAMKPTINGEAELLIDRSDVTLADGYIYALEIGTRALVRRVKLYLRHIVLVCDNPEYNDMVVEGEDLQHLKVIGRVRYIGQQV